MGFVGYNTRTVTEFFIVRSHNFHAAQAGVQLCATPPPSHSCTCSLTVYSDSTDIVVILRCETQCVRECACIFLRTQISAFRHVERKFRVRFYGLLETHFSPKSCIENHPYLHSPSTPRCHTTPSPTQGGCGRFVALGTFLEHVYPSHKR